MSRAATDWAWGLEIKASQKLLMLSLADRADELHCCYPSIQRLVKDTGMDRKTIGKWINQMIEDGFISDTGERKGKTKQVRVLRLNIEVKEAQKRNSTKFGNNTKNGHETSPILDNKRSQNWDAESVIEPNIEPTLSARGQFISEAAKRRIGISPNGEIPFPASFKPSADHIAIASEKGINIETELLNFRDYHQARGTKLIDWNSAFRVWLRNARVNPLSGRQRSEPDSPHWNSPEGWKDFI
ncbi:TPA: helix-turn-helix domain-containing protein [Klebsiella pneumoniae]|uniref:helix-turn-helix domain-containing protein n=1 Tax=Klebsiella pneumoniae TaxID=573 RepID=UPI000E2B8400|nr:helix-turn-helix domain-containing protein [Klebsiella pneumoniae]DAV24670.1 MAG TPA: Primosomal protein 1 [Caudoviricetes sp.]MBG2041315.1 helix-turn-helix domain-containing protein [Klebsiella pneumoniae]MDU6380945.1 helix-turn-helix domain-containing protein [Klebsiella pneumoniae]SXG44778.1 replication protein [Klebsiella pneumoniae]HBR3069744.1 helix-turn-helix domain-containing protein [Klebsiella pneumoniae]